MYQFQWHAVQFIESLSNISIRNVFTQPTAAGYEGEAYGGTLPGMETVFVNICTRFCIYSPVTVDYCPEEE